MNSTAAQKKTRKRKHSELASSDSETQDSDTTDSKAAESELNTSGRRQSSRLISRQNRPAFKLPPRDAVWKEIPSVKSPEKLSRLTPRKNISNFTKVYNSYNFDDYEDTSDEDDGVSDSDSSSDANSNKKGSTGGRVRNYHRRIRTMSTSSDEDDTQEQSVVPGQENISALTQVQAVGLPQADAMSSWDSDKCEDFVKFSHEKESCSQGTNIPILQVAGAKDITDVKNAVATYSEKGHSSSSQMTANESDDSEEEVVSPSKKAGKLKRKCITDSDDDNDEKRSGTGDDSNNTERESCTESDAEDSDRPSCDRWQRAANAKIKQKNVFSDFKDAISKRKASLKARKS